jgi:hypothetical protein
MTVRTQQIHEINNYKHKHMKNDSANTTKFRTYGEYNEVTKPFSKTDRVFAVTISLLMALAATSSFIIKDSRTA